MRNLWWLWAACTDPTDLSAGKLDADSGVPTSDDSAPPIVLPAQCAAPAAEVVYAEVPGLLDTTDSEMLFMEQGAAAMADLDGDGDDDVLLSFRNNGLYFQHNDGGALGPPELVLAEPLISSVALGDIDGDRDLDVLVAGHADRVTVLQNDGAGQLSPIEAGLPEIRSTVRGASFGDADGDGDLDLALAVAGDGPDKIDRLFLNDGSGWFTDGILPEGLDGDGLTWDPVWSDLDRDGDQDLYLVNAEQTQDGTSRLLRNDGGAFAEITSTCACGATGNPMGASVADFSGDLLPDLYITGTGTNFLLLADTTGAYIDATAAYGAGGLTEPDHMAYGAYVFDHDNDGWDDILVATGPLGDNRFSEPDLLLLGGPGGFVEGGPALGLDDMGNGRATVGGLFNDDGLLDPLVSHLGAPSVLRVAPCTENRALIVDLVGNTGNTFGVGAWIELDTPEGTRLREVTSHAGWASAIHPRAHFGLGDSYAERIRVYWPNGTLQTVELGPDTPLRIVVAQE